MQRTGANPLPGDLAPARHAYGCYVPRAPRNELAAGIYHVTSRGNRRQAIFLDRRDHRRFLGALEDVVVRNGWLLYAYCLMPNHFHLLLETRAPTLGLGMHGLNGTYAQWFNWRHDVDGHLFGDRYHSRRVETDFHLLESTRYVVLNPVRAKLVAHPAQWEWSSYRATVGACRAPAFLAVPALLAHFGRASYPARRTFRRFVYDAPARAAA